MIFISLHRDCYDTYIVRLLTGDELVIYLVL